MPDLETPAPEGVVAPDPAGTPDPAVTTDQLVGTTEVAEILGLSHRHSVSTYRRRYADFPEPALSSGRIRLWRRSDVLAWRAGRRHTDPPALAADKREALLDAAADLMASRTMAEIPIREIAARAGLPHSLIYRHVGSKLDLERAVIDRSVDDLLAAGRTIGTAGPEVLQAHLRLLLQRRTTLLLLLESMHTSEGARHVDEAPVIAAVLATLRSEISTSGPPAAPSARLPALTPELAVGAVAALLVGWTVFEPRILAGTGLAATPVEQLAELGACLLDLARGTGG